MVQPEALNKKAIQIINRVRDKLTGETCCTNNLDIVVHKLLLIQSFDPLYCTLKEPYYTHIPVHFCMQCLYFECLHSLLFKNRLNFQVKFQCVDESLFPAGRDFSHDETLDVPTQVELLIKQATSHENLCQCYIGWSVLLLQCLVVESN